MSPLRTLIAASWPATSGARRISVARTTPAIGAAGAERNRKYPPRPAATRATPSKRIRLAMGVSPLGQGRRRHGEREVNQHQDPQAAPVARHLPEVRAELADAHDAIDR